MTNMTECGKTIISNSGCMTECGKDNLVDNNSKSITVTVRGECNEDNGFMDDTPSEGETQNGTAYLGVVTGGVQAECGKDDEGERYDEPETLSWNNVRGGVMKIGD